MSAINAKEFIDELVFCLKEEDVVKARALLQFASDANISPDIQKQALAELARGPERVVFQLLEYLTKIEITSPEVQESLYDLILEKAYANADLVSQYITANEKRTRLLFLRAAGDLMLADTALTLHQIIQTDQDPEIVAAAVQALGALRMPDSVDVLGTLATHADPDVRKSVIFAIADAGTQDAADTLVNFLGENEETNKLAVEALADMQDLYALEKLTALLASSTTLVRDTAIDQLMKLGFKATPILTRAFKNAEADYLVHLITTLGYINDPAAIPSIVKIINTQPKDPNIRQAAYEAMERIPSAKTAICLAQGLQDPIEAVRMSAARAIDKNLSKPLVAGLKNIIREESQGALNAVSALIDTEAGNIFSFLMDEPAFQKLAKTHMVETATLATRKTFLKNMVTIGQKAFAADLAKEITENGVQQDKTARIVVVDDSKMMLRLYQNKLSALGFSPESFHLPELAIKAILDQKPDLVITDLNMPDISGLELTREIRRKFTRQALPVLMITTQSDFISDETADSEINEQMLTKSGINMVLHKPFTDEDFKKAVLRFLS